MGNFISWLVNTLYGPQAGDINALAKTVLDAFSYEDQRITDEHNLDASAQWYANQQEVNDVNTLTSSITLMASTFMTVLTVSFTTLRQYVDNRVDGLASSLSSQLDWFMKTVNLLFFGLRLLIDGVRQWVESAIAGPLWNALNAFIKLASQQIWELFQYILHPELLVKLIAGYLWQTWIHLLHVFAVPIARYLMRTMLSLREEFVGILIDVLSEII